MYTMRILMGTASTFQVNLLGLLCSLLSFLFYLNTRNGELVFDDRVAIEENMDLKPTSPWTNILRNDFWGSDITHHTSHKSYRPICTASFKINYLLHGLEPMGYHLGNIVINSLVSYLFVFLSWRVFAYELGPTLIAGLLYAVHPIHTEAVAGVVGRAELLSALFFLLAVLTYHTQEDSYKWKRLFSTLFFCLCSFLSKEQGIMAAAGCVSYELFIINKMDFSSTVRLLTRKGMMPKRNKILLSKVAVLALFSIVLVVSRMLLIKGGPSFSKLDHPGQLLATPFRQLYYLHLLFVNAWLLLSPSHLIHDYRFGVVPLVESFADYRHLCTAGLLASIVLFAFLVSVKQRTKSHVSIFALSLTALFFLPSSNLFIRVGFVAAERVLYTPSMGLCLLVSLGAWRLIKSKFYILKRVVIVGLGVVIISHSLKTFNRGNMWNSSFQLFVEALKVNPTNGLLYSDLGYTFEKRNESELAEEAHKLSIKLSPNNSQPFRNYGGFLKKLGRYQEAEVMLRRVIQLAGRRLRKYGKTVETYRSLAEIISLNESRINESLHIIERLTFIAPDHPTGHYLKAIYLKKLDQQEKASHALEKAMKLAPDIGEMRLNAGKLYLEMNDTRKAEQCFKDGLKLEPQNGYIILALGMLLINSSSVDDVRLAHKCLSLVTSADPSLIEAQYNIGLLYVKSKHYSAAADRFLKVIEYDLHHCMAHLALGYVYYKLGNFTGVIESLESLPINNIIEGNSFYDVIAILGQSYTHSNQKYKAEELYKKVLQIDQEKLKAQKYLKHL